MNTDKISEKVTDKVIEKVIDKVTVKATDKTCRLSKAAVFSWILLVIWMAVIFISSAQTADVSDANSRGVVTRLIEAAERLGILPADISEDPKFLGALDHYFRKLAHFLTYLIMAALSFNALYQSGVRNRRLIWLAFLICVVYAGIDEFHQLYVPGRGGQVTDVVIDSAGAALGLGLCKIAKGSGPSAKIAEGSDPLPKKTKGDIL